MPYKYTENGSILISFVNPYPSTSDFNFVYFCPIDITQMNELSYSPEYQVGAAPFCPQDLTGMNNINYTLTYESETAPFCPQDLTGMNTFAQAP